VTATHSLRVTTDSKLAINQYDLINFCLEIKKLFTKSEQINRFCVKMNKSHDCGGPRVGGCVGPQGAAFIGISRLSPSGSPLTPTNYCSVEIRSIRSIRSIPSRQKNRRRLHGRRRLADRRRLRNRRRFRRRAILSPAAMGRRIHSMIPANLSPVALGLRSTSTSLNISTKATKTLVIPILKPMRQVLSESDSKD
jgi:hypothetical protein